MTVLLEIFGYIGSALVLLSMMMTSINKLRHVNMAGALISTIYAVLTDTWPVVFLNLGTIAINTAQLIRAKRAAALCKE